MRKISFNNKGLSLVEVVMSALIVSMLMAGLFAVYISAKNLSALALHKTVALAWASSKIEGRKNGADVAYNDPSDENMLADDKGGGVNETDTNYRRSMIRHSVIVSWTE